MSIDIIKMHGKTIKKTDVSTSKSKDSLNNKSHLPDLTILYQNTAFQATLFKRSNNLFHKMKSYDLKLSFYMCAIYKGLKLRVIYTQNFIFDIMGICNDIHISRLSD